ncbi:MAG: DNA replication/repair protein RecF [Gammaproteobacteria bacterium]|nr:DNA replication/repair protein RecF [Gammaproteobacteria bacterium]
MHLTQLKLLSYRNFKTLSFIPHPRVNLIVGPNGSGKTNLLEAIYHLGTGKSFRSTLSNRIIQQGAETTHIYGVVEKPGFPFSIGVQRQRNSPTVLVLNQQNVANAGSLASLFPLRLINPDSFNLLIGGPKYRRHLLNWGTFHVEHQFWETWKLTTRILKQRNAALKKGAKTLIKSWDKQLEHYALALLTMNQHYYCLFEPIFLQLIKEFLPKIQNLSLRYFPGWDIAQPLSEILEVNYPKDQQRGRTHAGPHRADLKIKVANIPAKDILSRGQQKLVACALLLAQGILLKQHLGIHCAYLLDDLAAELDQSNLKRVCNLLYDIEAQLFISSLEQNAVFHTLFPPNAMKVFHVEHFHESPSLTPPS